MPPKFKVITEFEEKARIVAEFRQGNDDLCVHFTS